MDVIFRLHFEEVSRRLRQLSAEMHCSQLEEGDLEGATTFSDAIVERKRVSRPRKRVNRPQKKTRSKRTKFDERQSMALQSRYRQDEYISVRESQSLAESLGLSTDQVRVYFKNRRSQSKNKKKMENMTAVTHKTVRSQCPEDNKNISESNTQSERKPKAGVELKKLPAVPVNSHSIFSSAPSVLPNMAQNHPCSCFSFGQAFLNSFFGPPCSSIMSVQNAPNDSLLYGQNPQASLPPNKI